MMRAIYEKYCSPKLGAKAGELLMSMAEWLRFVNDVGMLDDNFTKREARLCFTWSKMLVADEVKRETAWTTMRFLDFLEAQCRMSELKDLPTGEHNTNA